MEETGTSRKRGANDSVDTMMNDILEALEVIRKKLPNGELKLIQERIENIDSTQEDMKEDLRAIKRQLLDPEDGIVVRVNKNTDYRKKKEGEEHEFTKMLDEHKEILAFKVTVNRVLWILFTALAGIIVALFFGQGVR
jgi:vacuolar-type H+-ATPase subunit E/Vma4